MLFEDLVRGSLRGFQSGKTFHKFAANPVGDKNQSIPPSNGKHGGLQGRQLRAHHAATQEQYFLDTSLLGSGTHQNSLHISNAKPSHQAMLRIDGSKAKHRRAARAKSLVAAFHQRNDGLFRARFENGHGRLRGVGSFFTVPNSVYRRDQDSMSPATNQMAIARFALARENRLGHAVFHQWQIYNFHFFTVTIVPRPGSEAISKSSIKRRTPGRPRPRLPDVEKPSRMA